MRFLKAAVLCLALSGLCAASLCAQDIVVLFTGETHAMLYPCNCPFEPDGGVARRSAFVAQVRKENPNVLLVDSGGFFAGGLMDEYTQNTGLDTQRTLVQLKAMALMRYDAVAIGDDELNFGKEFLEARIDEGGFPFLSANIKGLRAKPGRQAPFIIKEVGGVKFGIVGVTTPVAAKKDSGLEVVSPKEAVGAAVEELKKQGAQIMVVLSHLGESEDQKLLQEVAGIDILVIGNSRMKEEAYTRQGQTLILRPSWQGRKIGKLTLRCAGGKIVDYKIEEFRLSDKLSDDPAIKAVLPRCFSDSNCKEKDSLGVCRNPGTSQAVCEFTKAPRVGFHVIVPRVCATCDTARVIRIMQSYFPGLSVTYLSYPEGDTQKLMKDLGIRALPAYLLDPAAEKEKGFDALKEHLERKGAWYVVKTSLAGMSYFPEREKVKGRLDVFLSLYEKEPSKLLEAIKTFGPQIHFLAVEKEEEGSVSGFSSAKGRYEVEEYLRAVCLKRYCPAAFFEYLLCRAKNIDSSWWEDCLTQCDAQNIKACARGTEGRELLRENTRLNKELEVMFGPTYLVDNQEIFTTQGVPSKEELGKILRR